MELHFTYIPESGVVKVLATGGLTPYSFSATISTPY